MNISKRRLKKIIREEISTRRRHLPRLADILFEEKDGKSIHEDVAEHIPGTSASKMKKAVDIEAADELEKWMKTPLADLPADPAESLSDDAQRLAKKGGKSGDGDKADDKAVKGASSAADIALSGLQASQNEVGMKQSLANVLQGINATWDGIDWGNVDDLIEMMKPGATITFDDALLGATTSNGDVVLDGHHRWSQATMVNPEGKVNIILSKASGLTADQVLKAVHLAILRKTGQDKTKSAKGGNLFDAGPDDVKGHLDASERKVDPATLKPSKDGVAPYIAAVMKMKGITDVEEGTTAAIERVMAAIKSLKGRIVDGAPARTKMPQADDETNPIDGAEAAKQLDTGKVNYAPPYVEAITYTNDQLIKERWQRLAGLVVE